MTPQGAEIAAPAGSLVELAAHEAVAAMRAGDLRCEDYARALLDRAAALARLNAFRTLDHERVLEAARAADRMRASGAPTGRLHGLPIPVKDSVNTRELPTSNGTRALGDFRPRENAAVLRPLFAAGAILMGKTSIHELSRGWTSNNGAFGPVSNPYDPRRIPGGSSGGSAAAVAARMAPLAIAEDTLGSIRVPSTFCGVAGFRPTLGRYPADGIMPLTLGRFDQVGPLARCVADIVLFDQVVTGDARAVERRDPRGVRLGLSDYLLSDLDAEVERIARGAIDRLERAGAVLVRAEIPEGARDAYNVAREIIGFENRQSIAAFLRENAIPLSFDELIAQASPNVREMYQTAFTSERHARALRDLAAIRAALEGHFAEHALDAMLFPAVLVPAPPIGDYTEIAIGGANVPFRYAIARNTALAACASLASLTLPAGLTSQRLPVGMELVSVAGRDRSLLEIGLGVEAAWGPIPAP